MSRFPRRLAPGIVLIACSAAGWSQPVVTCPRAAAAPRLDGRVTDAEWHAAASFSPFLLLHDRGLPGEATDVRAMYDDQALYLAAVLHDERPEGLLAKATQRDGEAWRDDCLEVFIDALGTGKSYVHFVVNSLGTQFDELGGDVRENFRWDAGVAVHERDWAIEMAIPFGGGRAPAEGSEWRLGVARNAAHLSELSSWDGFLNGFHEPERFGFLRFGGLPVSFSLVDMGARKLGANAALLVVENADRRPLELKAHAKVTGRTKSGQFLGATRFTALAAGRTVVHVPYEVHQDGEGSVVISVSDPKGVVIYRTAAFPIRVPETAAPLFRLEGALADASREWARLPRSPLRDSLRRELDAVTTEWQGLNALAAHRAALTLDQLRELEAALNALLARVDRLSLRVRANAAAPGCSFAVTPVSALRKVFPDDHGLAGAPARLEACRNERESLQLVVQPVTDRTVKLSAAAGELKGAAGVIPASCVELRPVGFVPAASHRRPEEGKRLWPDILGPLLETWTGGPNPERQPGRPLEIAPTITQPLWLTVRVPADTPPGEYAGEVRLQDEGGPPVAVPLTVAVHQPVLPDPTRFRFCLDLWQDPQSVARQYRVLTWSRAHWDLLRAYLQDLAAHGQRLATVTRDMVEWRRDAAGGWLFHYDVLDRYVALAREVGIDGGIEYLAMFNPGGDSAITWADADGTARSETANPGSKAFDEAWAAFLADLAKHLAEKGWLKDVFICPADEPRDQPDIPTLQRFARCAELVHAASPEFRTTVALDFLDSAKALAPCVDRMVLKLRDDVYRAELAAQKRAAGGRAEAYICCHPDRPNTFITSPNLESRVIGWLLCRENLDGLLRWSYERWPQDPRGQPEGDGSLPVGDLFLVYPGPEGPYPSPRWELLREGIEDYECLHLLADAIAAARAAGRNAEADRAEKTLQSAVKQITGETTSLAAFVSDPSVFSAARVAVLRAFEQL